MPEVRDGGVLDEPAVFSELRRLGLVPATRAASAVSVITPDRVADALCEAFGGDEWRALPDGALVDRLRAAAPPCGVSGHRRPRYAALTRGDVLDCVTAFGFDDAADGAAAAPRASTSLPTDSAGRLAWIDRALRGRGYREGIDAAAPLLARRGRTPTDDGCSRFYSRSDALTLAPIAGPARSVAVVVRVIGNADGRHGAAAAAALLDGLQHAGVCVYAGHGRYGLGPDFEPAIAIRVADGAGLPADPSRLARAARAEARRQGETMEAVLDRWRGHGRLWITRDSAGRVRLGDRNLVPRHAGSRLVHWIASRADGAGPAVVPTVGPYRVWVLLCCRGGLLLDGLRRAPGSDGLRLVAPRGLIDRSDLIKFPWILDSLCAGRTWEDLGAALELGASGIFVDGIDHDPCIP